MSVERRQALVEASHPRLSIVRQCQLLSIKRPGRQPLDMSKVDAAIKLVEARVTPTEAARQLGIGRSTIYREMRRLGIGRPA